MRIVKTGIGSFATVVLLSASAAMAQSRTDQLKGDYAFIDSTVCVNSPAGFSPSLTPIDGTSVITFSFTGVLTFNGNGTGSLSARGDFLNNPGGASAADSTADFTYGVAADRTVTFDQGTTSSTFVAGPNVGHTVTVSSVPTLVGHMSSDRKSIVLGSFDPGIEVVSPAGLQRICHRSRTAIRIGGPGSQGNGDD